MRTLRTVAAAAVIAIAIALRFSELGAVPAPLWDEWLHAPTAVRYLENGVIHPDDWWHPPLKHLVRGASIRALGDGPVGYRLPNALLGVLSVVLVVLVARRLVTDRWTPWLAAALLATDPLHVLMSRTTPEEILGGCAVLAAVWLSLRALERPVPNAMGAGLCLGLAMAVKWYYGPAAVVLAAATVVRSARRGELDLARAAYLAASYALLPAIAYLLAFYPWFASGRGLGDFARHELDALRMIRRVREDMGSPVFMQSRRAAEWFVRRLAMGVRLDDAGVERPRLLVFMNAYPLVLLVIPGTLAAAWAAWRRRSLELAVVAAVFVLTYAQFLLLDRPVYVYSAAAVLPFAWVLVAVAVALLDRAPRLHRIATVVIAAVAVAVVTAEFPLLSGGERWEWPIDDVAVPSEAIFPHF